MIPGFEFLGLGQRDFPQDLVNKFQGKKLVIVGGARCVWDDLALLGVRGGPDNAGWHVMTINDITMHFPGRIKHLYSNDHRMFAGWLGARRRQYQKFGPIEYVHSCRTGGKYQWPWPGHGTSALGAVYTGIALGYDPIVLCGVPLDDQPSYFSPDWEVRNFSREVGVKNGTMQYWGRAAKKCFNGRVRSMSGRTRELLGPP